MNGAPSSPKRTYNSVAAAAASEELLSLSELLSTGTLGAVLPAVGGDDWEVPFCVPSAWPQPASTLINTRDKARRRENLLKDFFFIAIPFLRLLGRI